LVAFGVGCKAVQRRVYRPAETVKNYYKYIEEGNADEVAKLLYKGSIERLFGGMDGLRKHVAEESESIKRGGGFEYVQIDSDNVNGELGTVDITLKTRKNPKTVRYRVGLGWGPDSTGWEIMTWDDLS
jgi:hypothetical protein